MKKLLVFVVGIILSGSLAYAQNNGGSNFMRGYDNIQYFRSYDQRGINVFETPKQDSVTFDGMRLRIGAGFTQQFQGLEHENAAGNVPATDARSLRPITYGFNNASANLNLDFQLADGIRLHVGTYLSSRHHQETWVKGGYIQFDKLPFNIKFFDDLMKYMTIKVGHMEINYNDAHFRRSDSGQTLYNPFMENYIADAFTTEIGGEVYFQHTTGFLAMLGVTNGEIKGSIDQLATSATDPNANKSPAVYGKIGFDNRKMDGLRFRVTGSFYNDNSSQNNTLFWGDRTGSNYFLVMEKTGSTTTAQAWSGRFNPRFSDKISSMTFNAFIKYKGLEFFGNYDNVSGRTSAENADRKLSQIAADLVYRIGTRENTFLGFRYNQVTAREVGSTADISINRTAFAAGWFVTPTILLKGEYMLQNYNDFASTDIRSGGKISGFTVEAIVGF